jgi:hypothetical protein
LPSGLLGLNRWFIPKMRNHFEHFYDAGTEAIDYTMSYEYTAGIVFALAKYGYRIDLGFSFLVVSVDGMVTPPMLFSEEGNEAWWSADWTANADDEVTNWDEAKQLASRYQVELSPVIINAQIGFSLNY